MRFTEPLNGRLSRAGVTDPGGRRFEGRTSGSREILVRLSTNAPGVYRVDWTTVSVVDGHTLRGTFAFGVGVTPTEEARTTLAPGRGDLLIAAARAVEYAALLLAVGMLLLARLARRDPPLTWVRHRPSAALAVALAAGVTVVVGEAAAASSPPSVSSVGSYLTTGLPGIARVGRLGAEALALGALIARPTLAAVPIGAALLSLAAAGHAAAVRPAWWGITVDGLHLASAGLWAGAILAFALLRPPEGWRGPEARRLVDRFSPVAIPAFLVTVSLGTLRGVQELSALRDLWASSYGQVLSLKVAGVLAMVPLSALAWRRLAHTPRVEAALAVFVVAAAALLAAYPLPPGRAKEAEPEPTRAAPRSALPRAGDLTLGAYTGDVLVGVTMKPARPGRNDLFFTLLPPEVPEDPAALFGEVTVAGSKVILRRCGPTCFAGTADLHGGERVVVRVMEAGVAAFELPDLPAPDGAALLRRMQKRMHGLRTVRFDEELRPPEPPIRTAYVFQAPDRYSISSSTGFATVVIGTRQYRRTRATRAWEAIDAGSASRVPFFLWDSPPLLAPTIVGRDAVDGVATDVLSFFHGDQASPIWFRLWVDAEGLVRRAEMRATAHFMDHRYRDFDAPLQIEPPVRP